MGSKEVGPLQRKKMKFTWDVKKGAQEREKNEEFLEG